MAAKREIEVRDPLHVFVKLAAEERPVFDCAALQRLRHVHQLAMTYLVYPGATHRRFEHSLGVMELASRMYDVVTAQEHLTDAVRDLVPAPGSFELGYWRRVLRMAALLHDTGHLPFSHAAEHRLLPDGINHETLTALVIRSEPMLRIWSEMKLQPHDIVALATEPEGSAALAPWPAILNEIITSAVFGADRMDYLLRDSLHTGVAYGRFDHFRLIDTLRILPPAPAGDDDPGGDPTLGIEAGGRQSAEQLLLARYFMFSQVYLHRIRRIYDIHLMDFLTEWLETGQFATELDAHLAISDNEVNAALLVAARDAQRRGHIHASRIIDRRHFKVLYEPSPVDIERNSASARQVYEGACERFGADAVRLDEYAMGSGSLDFPVLLRDGRIASSTSVSDVLARVPVAVSRLVFIDRDLQVEAALWRDDNLAALIEARPEEDEREEAG